MSVELDRLLEEKRALLCGVVELELLQSVKPKEKSSLIELLSGLAFIETDREDFRAAGELLGALRSRGTQIPTTDGLIGALCLRHDLPLLTLDRHFNQIPHLKKHKA